MSNSYSLSRRVNDKTRVLSVCAVERANNVNAVILGLNVKSIVSITTLTTVATVPELVSVPANESKVLLTTAPAVVNVPAEVCLHCGERLYSQETVRRFEEIRLKLQKRETEGFQPLGQSFKVADS